jgi:hypothetical protein
MRATIIAVFLIRLAADPAFAQTKEDAAVLDATLAKFAADFERTHHTPPKFLLFNETTVMLDQDVGYVGRNLPKQLVDALLLYNSVPQSLRGYSPPSPFQLATPVLLGSVLVNEKPGSIRPYYYFWTGCGYECATGYVYKLEKSNGVWRVVQSFSPWVT